MNTEIERINKQIAFHKGKISELEKRRSEIEASEKAITEELDAYKNAYEAMFDGVKTIANDTKPTHLKLPMPVVANMFYKYEGKTYVAVNTGIVNETNFDEFMEAWEV